MAFEQKPNTGSIFDNDRREADTDADMTGSALVDGKEYWVNAWHRESRDGTKKFIGFSFKEKEAK